MFGKNYDAEIQELGSSVLNISNNVVTLFEQVNKLWESNNSQLANLIEMAKVQKQHKEIIRFLLKSSTSSKREDFLMMLNNLSTLEKGIGKG